MPNLYLAGAIGLAALLAFGWAFNQGRKVEQARYIAKIALEEKKKEAAVAKEAQAGEDARLPAFQPGSIARLKRDWCRDC